MRRLPRRSWLLHSILFGTVLLLFTFGWLHYGVMLGDEKLLVQVSSLARDAFADSSFSSGDEFLFIDTAHDLELIEAVDDDGLPLGQQPITDRAKLARLFRHVAAADTHRFVLCDIFFLDPHDDPEVDAEMEAALNEVQDLVIPFTLDASGNEARPVLDIPKDRQALARYHQDDQSFVRFPLVQAGSLTTIPLHMYNALHPDKKLGPMHLTTFIPDLRIPPQAASRAIPLGQLLPLLSDSATVSAYVRDRIVVIGAFRRNLDEHDTILGSMAGPLLLANVYLALRHGDNVLSPRLLFFLWAAFVSLTWYSLRRELGPRSETSTRDHTARHAGSQNRPLPLHRRMYWRVREFGADRVENTVWLVLISMVTYFGFGLHLPVLLLAALLMVFIAALRWLMAPPVIGHWLQAAARIVRTLRSRLVRSPRHRFRRRRSPSTAEADTADPPSPPAAPSRPVKTASSEQQKSEP